MVRSLSIAMALPRWPLPVYLMPRRSKAAWTLPSSPQRPCRAMKTMSAMAQSSSTRSPNMDSDLSFLEALTASRSGAVSSMRVPPSAGGFSNMPSSVPG